MRIGLRLAAGLLTAYAAAAAVALPAYAADDNHTDHADRELTRTQATALVQQRYAARVVRASSTDEGGRHIYVFRLLSQAGKVWEVHIDARNGAEVR
jgi:uncharacterized membrane protein YkoI